MSALKSFVRYADDYFHSYFGKVKILFLVRNAYGLKAQLPILQEIVQRGRFEVRVAAEFEGCIDWDAAPALYEAVKPFLMDVKNAADRKWHFVIATDLPYIWFKRNATWIFMPHGAVFGALDQNNTSGESRDPYLLSILLSKQFSVYFCISNASLNHFERFSPEACGDERRKFFIAGYPPIDELYNSSREDGLHFLRELGLSSNRKTIVVGSHWTEKSLLIGLGYDAIGALCQAFSDTHNVILMGHPRLWRQGAGIEVNQSLRNRLFELDEAVDHFRFVPDLKSTIGLLRSADILVGDNSSFMTFFCVADKPILFFDHPDFEFANPEVGKHYHSASKAFSTVEELISSVERVSSEPDSGRQARADFVDLFIARKGQSAQYCADLLENMGRVCGPDSPNWKNVVALSEQDLTAEKAEQ